MGEEVTPSDEPRTCPSCGKTLRETGLAFCPSCGSPMASTRPTESFGNRDAVAGPRRGSNALLYVILGVLGLVVVVCGGGFFLLAVVASSVETVGGFRPEFG